MTKKTAKTIFICVVFITATFISLMMINKSKLYLNIIEFVFRHEIQDQIEKIYIREIESITTVERYVNIISTNDVRSEYVTVYMTDSIYKKILPEKMLHGNFLIEINPVFKHTQAVINEELATVLFSYTSIINESILINDKQYNIIGVTKSKGFIIRIFGSMEQHVIYLYESDLSVGINPERTSVLIKCRDKTSGVVLSALSAFELNASSEINHDAKARTSIFISYFLLFSGTMILLWKIIYKLKYLIPNKNYLTNKKQKVFVNIFLLALLSFHAIYILFNMHFTLDARLIPDSLASLNNIFNQLQLWFTLMNNGKLSGGLLDPELNLFSIISIFNGFVVIISGLILKKYINNDDVFNSYS